MIGTHESSPPIGVFLSPGPTDNTLANIILGIEFIRAPFLHMCRLSQDDIPLGMVLGAIGAK